MPSSETAVADVGKQFQALDEQDLLPLFSKDTTSRTFDTRCTRRSAASSQYRLHRSRAKSVNVPPAESNTEDDLGVQVELHAGNGGGGGGAVVGAGGLSMLNRMDSGKIGRSKPWMWI
jgi:hypothetical protein